MNPRTLTASTLARLFAIMAGLAILAGCGGSSSSTSGPGSPTASLSATTLTFLSQFVGSTSQAQMVTVSNNGTATLTFSSISVSGDFGETNTCTAVSAGGACTINVTFTPTQTGSRTGTLTITDNASGSPQTVGLTGTGTSVSLNPSTLSFTGVGLNSTSAPQSVTLKNMGTTSLAIASVALSGTDSADFALASGANVCPYAGGNLIAGGSCTIYVTFTPPSTGTLTATLTVTDNSGGTAGSTQTVALTGSSSGSNSVAVSVNFGPNGNQGTENSYYNGIFTTVSVCNPGSTTTCVSVPNVLVDTGSTGLRVLSSAITGVTLPQVNDGSGNNLYECYEFGDLAYTWGPVSMANVQIGGETASQVPTASGGTANSGIPIQVVTVNATAPVGSPCLVNSVGALNSVAALGANGILGIGNYPQDCGADCTTSSGAQNVSPYPYILCTSNGSSCQLSAVPLADQGWNPVAAFSSGDTNGEVLQLPSISSSGQATAQGTLIFGITDTALNGVTVYELDDDFGNFQSATLFGVSYTSTNSAGTFIDSGSNALYVLDPTTLTSLSAKTGVTSVTDCADNGFYCTSSTLNLPLILAGSNGTTSPTETLSIESADSLLNATDAALNDLGGDSGGTAAAMTDYLDLGLPFFYNRSIFVGIAGASTTYPNGYWAF